GPRQRRAGDVKRHGHGRPPGRNSRALHGAIILLANVIPVLGTPVVPILVGREAPVVVIRGARPSRRGHHQHEAQHDTEEDDSEEHLSPSHLTAPLRLRRLVCSLGRLRVLSSATSTLLFTLRARTKPGPAAWVCPPLAFFMMPPIQV